MKTRLNTKPRNTFVALSMRRKAGAHGKSAKAKRAAYKRQLKSELGNAQSMNNQACC